MSINLVEESCHEWVQWSALFSGNASHDEQKVIEYAIYTLVAVSDPRLS
jgi:hypothetical protein